MVRTTARLAGTPVLAKPERMLLNVFDGPNSRAREPRQLEIVEEYLHELFARELEHEVVLRVAFAAVAAVAAAAAAALRPRDAVTGHVFAVAGQHVLAVADAAVVERRLGDVLARHAHFAALLEVGELALADHLAHRLLHVRLVAAQEALAVDAVLAAVVEATVDEVCHVS